MQNQLGDETIGTTAFRRRDVSGWRNRLRLHPNFGFGLRVLFQIVFLFPFIERVLFNEDTMAFAFSFFVTLIEIIFANRIVNI